MAGRYHLIIFHMNIRQCGCLLKQYFGYFCATSVLNSSLSTSNTKNLQAIYNL